MESGDRRLDLIRPRPADGGGAFDQLDGRRNRPPIPKSAVLELQKNQAPVRVEPRRPASQVQPDQGHKSDSLGLPGEEAHQESRQPFGVPGQVPPDRLAAAGGDVPS
jgi:hypothetical protein